jgi:hypothetical protein
MKTWTRLGVALAVPLLWSATATGQGTTDKATGQARSPQSVEGQVVKIDRAQGRVTLRTADGSLHEFQAGPETLKALQQGDRIEARRRQ